MIKLEYSHIGSYSTPAHVFRVKDEKHIFDHPHDACFGSMDSSHYEGIQNGTYRQWIPHGTCIVKHWAKQIHKRENDNTFYENGNLHYAVTGNVNEYYNADVINLWFSFIHKMTLVTGEQWDYNQVVSGDFPEWEHNITKTHTMITRFLQCAIRNVWEHPSTIHTFGRVMAQIGKGVDDLTPEQMFRIFQVSQFNWYSWDLKDCFGKWITADNTITRPTYQNSGHMVQQGNGVYLDSTFHKRLLQNVVKGRSTSLNETWGLGGYLVKIQYLTVNKLMDLILEGKKLSD
jgi:hypothetical protein